MANAFTTGIAQSNTAANQSQANANQPWNTPVYDAAAGTVGAGNEPPGSMQNGAVGYDGSTWNNNGAQGAGFYRQQTAQEQAQSGQQYSAQQFRNNIPQTENTLYNQMASQQNQNMNAGIKQTQQNNSSRGLLYGGVNAGQEQGVRASASNALATGRSNINSGVETAANSMDQSAIDTGIAIQQQQQQMQDAIYSNAMAQMNAQNGAIGGLLGAAGMGVGMYLGAGTAAGAIGGGLLGAQAGKAVA